jgi:hypothetical protein
MSSASSGRTARFLDQGHWRRGQVHATMVASTLRLAPALQEAVEDHWVDAHAVPGVKLFDGAICRLEDHHSDAHGLHLHLSRTTYKTFIGTNARHPHWGVLHGQHALANPLGTSAALRSSDGHLIFGIRSPCVALYPGHAHPFGGTLDLPEAGSQVDLFAEMQRELSEEIGLLRSDVLDIAIIALAMDDSLQQPELIYAVTTALEKTQILARLDADEHSACWTIPDHAGSIRDMLHAGHTLTPVLRSTLQAWGNRRFAVDWLSR